eukprot:4617189-Pleurochrysis_carterae.AAC.3
MPDKGALSNAACEGVRAFARRHWQPMFFLRRKVAHERKDGCFWATRASHLDTLDHHAVLQQLAKRGGDALDAPSHLHVAAARSPKLSSVR